MFRSVVRACTHLAALMLLLSAVPAYAGTDVTPGQTGNEPHNAVVNPRNPAQVAVGRGCDVRISNDFGQTFPIQRSTTVSPCNGDISLAYDSQGRLFVTHLSRMGADSELTVLAGRVADTTTPGAGTYTPVVLSTDDGVADDKQWLVADANPTSPYRDNLYMVWTSLGSPSRIQFSRSTDAGQTWSPQAVISADNEGFVWPSHIAVASNGDLYVAYHTDTCGNTLGMSGTIPLLRDGSGGESFAAGEVPQKTNAFELGQATVTCNVQDSSGDEIPGTDFWMQGSVQPFILPDPARPGNVYVVANDDPNNLFMVGDDADVVIARSLDNGLTFTRGRVDHAPVGRFTVMPAAAIDQDGNIVVHWYDNRRNLRNGGTGPNGNDNFLLDVYGTTSRDGGVTFTNDFRINDSLFDPDVGAPCRFGSDPSCGTVTGSTERTLRIGEYNGLWTVNGIGYASWAGNATPPTPASPGGASGSQTIYFDVFSMLGAFPDVLEPNESPDFAVATALGADDQFNHARLTLHSATDADVFKVIAKHTGILRVHVPFNEAIAPQLRLEALDRFAQEIGVGALTTIKPGSSFLQLAIPAVAGQTYFFRVTDLAGADSAPPQSTYDLTIVNIPAPEPFDIDLTTTSDSGRFDNDDVTNVATPALRLRLDDQEFIRSGIPFSPSPDNNSTDDAPGYKVVVERNGSLLGFAEPVPTQAGVYSVTPSVPLPDGTNSVTAVVLVVDASDDPAVAGTAHSLGRGTVSSHALNLRVDTLAPATPAAPDLLASSDSGGISIDNITTISTPALQGSVEPNALVRLSAGGTVVGQDVATSLGAYKILSDALDDGVYDMSVSAEDLAGNVTAASGALSVTIANRSLNLAGPAGPVGVDLSAATVQGYPGVPGGVIGIRGIPAVTLDTGGQALHVVGGADADAVTYTPTGASSARLSQEGVAQVIQARNVPGQLMLDLLDGDDTVTVRGTTNADQIAATVAPESSVQIGTFLPVRMPTVRTERMLVDAGDGADTTTVAALDSISAVLTLDSANPAVIKTHADELIAKAGSPGAKLRNAPGASTEAAGSAFITYPSTGNETRVDDVGTERVRLQK